MFFWNSLAFSMIQWMLVTGSSAFTKSSLYIGKFSVHILLKLSLKDFEHYLARMWNECNCVVVWTLFGIALLWDWNENNFSSPEATVAFLKFVDILSEEHHHFLGFEIAQLEFHHLVISYLKCHFFSVGLVSSPRQNGSGLPLYICSFTLPFVSISILSKSLLTKNTVFCCCCC